MKAIEVWRAKCPLRVWVSNLERGAVSELARNMGVHRDTLEKWMAGIAVPRLKGFAKLQELTGITAAAWMDWLGEKPTTNRVAR